MQLQRVFESLCREGQCASAPAVLEELSKPLQAALYGHSGQVQALDAAMHLAAQAQGAPLALRRHALHALLVVIKGDRRGKVLSAVKEAVSWRLLPLLQGPWREETVEALHALNSSSPAPVSA